MSLAFVITGAPALLIILLIVVLLVLGAISLFRHTVRGVERLTNKDQRTR